MDACNCNNAAKFFPHGCCHSCRHDLSQAMKAMPSITVLKKCYRHSTMHVCHPLVTLAVATHNQQTSQPLYNPTLTKASGPAGQFLAPSHMTALTV